MPLHKDNTAGAVFSDDRKHRYILWREWDRRKPSIMFIGLNPSTANESEPDRTITRIIDFTKDWGYGGFYMVNIFTQVTEDPRKLDKIKNCTPDELLMEFAKECDKIVFAWGNFKEARERSKAIIAMFPEAYCLVKNKNGSPRHPLYIKGTTQLIKFNEL